MKRWVLCKWLLLCSACLVGAGCSSDRPDGMAQRLADREDIEETMHRYLQGLDHLDRDLYASSFAPDGVLDIDGSVRTGREAMRGVIDEEILFRKAMQDRGEAPRVLFHMESNLHLSFPDADHATRSAYWVTYVRQGKDPGGLSALGVGTSVDEMQRVSGKWLITQRKISLQP